MRFMILVLLLPVYSVECFISIGIGVIEGNRKHKIILKYWCVVRLNISVVIGQKSIVLVRIVKPACS